MADNNGTGTVVEPVATGAPAADGKESQGLGQPAGNQSTGGTTPEGGQGTANPSWMAQLPSDLKEDPEVMAILANSPTIGDYVRATIKREKSDGNKAPDGEAKKTEPVKYRFEKSLGEEADPFGLITGSLKETLEASQVSEEVALKVIEALDKAQKGSTTQLVEKGKTWCEAQLKKSWGDQYEANRKAMTRAYVAMVGQGTDLAAALDRTGASINPAVAELLSRIGKSIKEDGSVPSNQTGGTGRNPKVPVHYPD